MGLIKKLRKAKKEAPPNEKPAVVKTHLRDMIIVPEMIGSVVGIYNGKVRIVLFSCITRSFYSLLEFPRPTAAGTELRKASFLCIHSCFFAWPLHTR